MIGIDVSHHQGNIDWDKVKASGIGFAIIKICNGQNTVDSKAIRNIEECIRVGMPFGVYVYSYALNVNAAINEANLVLKTLAPYKDKISYPVVIDMEDADGYKAKHGMPSNETLVAICEKECLMFEEAGYYAAIYASQSWFNTKLKSEKLNRFDKWMAWWSTNVSSKFDHNQYGLWQYTSSGKVDGIVGNVDMNEAFKDYPKLILKKEEGTKFEIGQEYEALDYLVAKGRITNKEYWQKALEVVNNLKWIIINWANDVQKLEKQ